MYPVVPSARDLVDFELALRLAVADECQRAEWGRAFLTPSLPHVWDATLVAIERPGLAMSEVATIAEEAMAPGGYRHRTALIREPDDGSRLAAELAAAPGWEAERIEFMVWTRESGREAAAEVAEVDFERVVELRAELHGEFFEPDKPHREEMIEQLVELDRRSCRGGGNRWFAAPAPDPAAVCCLFSDGRIGQIEGVNTRRSARGGGLAQAVTLAALAASRAAGHGTTFLSVDAEDWPARMYAKLGFESIGGCHVLRRFPT